MPTARPDLRSGKRVDGAIGVNFEVAEGALRGQRLAIELALPLYGSLDGPQLETDWVLTVGWQYAFQLWGEHH